MNITVYSRLEHCPYCEKAKEALKQRDMNYSELVVGQDLDKDTFIKTIKDTFDKEVETVPQIIIDGVLIGGYDDLDAHFKNEELSELEEGFGDFDL